MSLWMFGGADSGGVGVATVKYWNGSAFVDKPLKRYDGAAFVSVPADRLKYWNGSAFVSTA